MRFSRIIDTRQLAELPELQPAQSDGNAIYPRIVLYGPCRIPVTVECHGDKARLSRATPLQFAPSTVTN